MRQQNTGEGVGFEGLVAWQKARRLTADIYAVTRLSGFAKDFGLNNQIQRAATSVMSNIAEGHGRSNDKEFSYFLRIAKASCAEVRCQLYVALDVGYIDKTTFEVLTVQADEVSRLISGLHSAVKRRIQNLP